MQLPEKLVQKGEELPPLEVKTVEEGKLLKQGPQKEGAVLPLHS